MRCFFSESDVIDFGDVCKKSVSSKELKIINNLPKNVVIHFDVSWIVFLLAIRVFNANVNIRRLIYSVYITTCKKRMYIEETCNV